MTTFASLVAAVSLTLSAPLVTSHRGGADGRRNPIPENTLPSIAGAFAEGADLVEVDVQLDAKGEPILWHNKRVRIGVRRIPAREVDQVDFPPVVGQGGFTTRVPLFGDALRLALESGCCAKVMDVELKVYHDCDRMALAKAVVYELVIANAVDRVIVTSRDHEILNLVKDFLPDVETGLIVVRTFASWHGLRDVARQCPSKVEWVIVHDSVLLQGGGARDLVLDAHRRGMRIGFWTVNRRRRLRLLSEAGAEMIITDETNAARTMFPCSCCAEPPPADFEIIDPGEEGAERIDPRPLEFEMHRSR